MVEERPSNAASFAATILRAFDIIPGAKIPYDGFDFPLVDQEAEPLNELFS